MNPTFFRRLEFLTGVGWSERQTSGSLANQNQVVPKPENSTLATNSEKFRHRCSRYHIRPLLIIGLEFGQFPQCEVRTEK
jgi:hypothetical protein